MSCSSILFTTSSISPSESRPSRNCIVGSCSNLFAIFFNRMRFLFSVSALPRSSSSELTMSPTRRLSREIRSAVSVSMAASLATHVATAGFTARWIAASAAMFANAAGGVPSEPYSLSLFISETTSSFLAPLPALRAPSSRVFMRPRPPVFASPSLRTLTRSPGLSAETTSTVRFSCSSMCASLDEYGRNITSRSGRFGRGANPPAMRDRWVLMERAPSIEARRWASW
mmetsp:Transcript_3463/g.7225  ORF Transcript_3463/g.7225 Transcript_3463/m.7225 type:complete len:228 (+) Transcript_3463:167-850(+)